MLAADGTAVGEERGSRFFMGWVFRNAAQEAGLLAESYESACVFIHVNAAGRIPNGTKRSWKDCPVRSPLWNDGANHVMIDFGDMGR